MRLPFFQKQKDEEIMSLRMAIMSEFAPKIKQMQEQLEFMEKEKHVRSPPVEATQPPTPYHLLSEHGSIIVVFTLIGDGVPASANEENS